MVQAVQSADVLGNRSAPGNGQRQEQGVQPRVVETFADVSSGGKQYPLLVLGNGRQAGDQSPGFLGPRAAAKHDEVANARRQLGGQAIEMLVAFGQHQGRTAFPHRLHDFIANRSDCAARRR